MQISLLKHLKFPEPKPLVSPGSEENAAAGATSSGSAGGAANAGNAREAGAAGAARRAELQEVAKAKEVEAQQARAPAPSVIVSIRGNASGLEGAEPSADLVYTAKRNQPAQQDPLESKFVGTESEVFVHFAVNTMRQFAEEQERAKGLAKAAQAQESHLLPRNLGDVQKLAARFKLFA